MNANNNRPGAALLVMLSLLCAFAFLLSFLWSPTPERLLMQGMLLLMAINGLDPIVSRSMTSSAVRALFAMAYFVPRLATLAVISYAIWSHASEAASNLAQDSGWALGFDIARGLFFVVFYVLMSATMLLTMVAAIWGDAYGRKPRDAQVPTT